MNLKRWTGTRWIWIIVAVGHVDPKWEPYLNGGHTAAPHPAPHDR